MSATFGPLCLMIIPVVLLTTNLHTVEIIILMPLTAVTAVEDVTSQSQVQGPDNCSTVSTASGHGGTIGPGH